MFEKDFFVKPFHRSGNSGSILWFEYSHENISYPPNHGSMVILNEEVMINAFTVDNDPITGVQQFYCKQCEFRSDTQTAERSQDTPQCNPQNSVNKKSE